MRTLQSAHTNGNGHWSLAKWHNQAAPDSMRLELEHRVAFLARQQDFDCVMLAKFGMEAETIARYTRMSKGQVHYRLKKLGVKLRDFRQGKGAYARLVFEGLKRRAAQQVTIEVRAQISDAKHS